MEGNKYVLRKGVCVERVERWNNKNDEKRLILGINQLERMGGVVFQSPHVVQRGRKLVLPESY